MSRSPSHHAALSRMLVVLVVSCGALVVTAGTSLAATVNEVAGDDLSDFYNLLARSTHEMPFRECLGYAGLDINLRPLPDATAKQIAVRRNWMSSSR